MMETINPLKYEGNTVIVTDSESDPGFDFYVYSNFDDAFVTGGWEQSIDKIKSLANSPGDKVIGMLLRGYKEDKVVLKEVLA